jgi:hypothetical protein
LVSLLDREAVENHLDVTTRLQYFTPLAKERFFSPVEAVSLAVILT